MKSRKPLKKSCKVYLIGAGPAGVDLMTVKGLALLRQADVVIYDYLTDPSLLAEAKKGAQLFNCRDLGKVYGGDVGHAQAKINALIVKKAKEGGMVVRLKNGDPFIFSRASEEIQALRKNRIAFEVVPGVTAASGAACRLGVPLTDRKIASSVVFVTGHECQDKGALIDWKGIAKSGTIVIYMGLRNIAMIAQQLIKSGKPSNTPAAAISYAGRPHQKIVFGALDNIASRVAKKGITAPSIFIIGKTVAKARII